MGWVRMPRLNPTALVKSNTIFVSDKRFAVGSYCMWTLSHQGSSPKVNLSIDRHSKIQQFNIRYNNRYRRNPCFVYNVSPLFLTVYVLDPYV